MKFIVIDDAGEEYTTWTQAGAPTSWTDTDGDPAPAALALALAHLAQATRDDPLYPE